MAAISGRDELIEDAVVGRFGRAARRSIPGALTIETTKSKN
jgi:hypothetical protein